MELQGEGYASYSDAEYSLRIEEYLRDCTPATFGFAYNPATNIITPMLVLEKPLENRTQYEMADIDSKWVLTQDCGMVDTIFLNMLFNKTHNIRVCFDKTMFCEPLMDWFELLIHNNGELVLSDIGVIREINGIIIPNVPIDIPEFLVREVRIRLRK